MAVTHEPLNVIYGLKLKDELYPVRYVGLTSRGASVRFKEHCLKALTAETPLYRWIRKHGHDKIECVILDVVEDPELLDAREIHWINELGTFIGENNLGFNLTRGGTGLEGYDLSYQLSLAELKDEASGLLREMDEMLQEWQTGPQDHAAHALLAEKIENWYSQPASGVSISLEHFASLESAKKCSTCRLPAKVLSQVEQARTREAPIPFTVVSRWLEIEGFQINPLTIPNHFRQMHHIRVTV